MGRVRPVFIKKISKELIKKYGDKFSLDFEENKKILNNFVEIQSKVIRNRVAGYITHLVKEQKRQNTSLE